jgi:hypothetical protein
MGNLRRHSVHRQAWPGYPTKLQVLADAELLKQHLPPKWLSHPELAAAAGVFLAANVAGCGGEPAPGFAGTETGAPAAAPALVAPVFLHGAGRFKSDPWLGLAGRTMGEAAPPTYLAEEDALAIIADELNQVGLLMTDREVALDVAVHGHDMHFAYDWVNQWWDVQPVDVTRPLIADLAEPQRRVYIEYLTEFDYYHLGGESDGPVASFPDLARQLAEHVRRQSRGIVFGVFYDPIPEQDHRAAQHRAVQVDARRLLQQQVRDFVDWLKAQGVI